MKVQTNRFLSEFSTFGIGGPIRYFIEATQVEEIQAAYRWAASQQLPILVVGKGSNCLFSDVPYNGLVLLNRLSFCTFDEAIVQVGAGFSFSLLGVQSARNKLSGLEFACGIPATVGGAIFMNAGANGQETSQTLTTVTYLHERGEIQTFQREELAFSYRKSPFQAMKGCILSATFRLTSNEEARKDQLAIIDYRMKTQPLKDKSAGCVFRNPSIQLGSKQQGAGALIEQCGLKGLRVGGAQVSEIHANFIVNTGAATANDVQELIRIIQEKVFGLTGIQLDPEILIHSSSVVN